jgi:hypothetical protein
MRGLGGFPACGHTMGRQNICNLVAGHDNRVTVILGAIFVAARGSASTRPLENT